MLGAFVKTSKTQISRELDGVHVLIDEIRDATWVGLSPRADEYMEVAGIIYRAVHWYLVSLDHVAEQMPAGAQPAIQDLRFQMAEVERLALTLRNWATKLVNTLASWEPGEDRSVIMRDVAGSVEVQHDGLNLLIQGWGQVVLAMKQLGQPIPIWQDVPIPIRVRDMDFSVLLDPFDDSQEMEDLVRAGMDRAAAQLQRALPRELVRRLPRVIVDVKEHADENATTGLYNWRLGTVRVYAGLMDPEDPESVDKVVNVIIHELGHFIWFTAVGSMGAKAWQQYFAAIEQKVNFRKLSAILDEKLVGTGLSFCEFVGAADEPGLMMLTIRVQEALKKLTGIEYSAGAATRVGSQCHACLCQNVNEACKPPRYTSPFVTHYGATCAPELFAEGFAVYVGKGPSELDPEMRAMFEQLIPRMKTAGPSSAVRELSDQQFSPDAWTHHPR